LLVWSVADIRLLLHKKEILKPVIEFWRNGVAVTQKQEEPGCL
jgi:hypothetical protein